ncbi:MAG: TRAP transporter TatT component family protein, partial [Nitrospiraceae bacterium]
MQRPFEETTEAMEPFCKRRAGVTWSLSGLRSKERTISLLAGLLAVVLLSGCSVKRLAADLVGDALAGDSDVFSSDDDPELVREAIPFGLKTYESLLAISPGHQGLLLSAAKGFT